MNGQRKQSRDSRKNLTELSEEEALELARSNQEIVERTMPPSGTWISTATEAIKR